MQQPTIVTNPYTLDNLLKIVQITFYVVGAIVAILTYRSAKRGLLNTVNTEYQKRVMDRLKELADELASEFDPNSSNHWINDLSIDKEVEEINKRFAANRKEILKQGKFIIPGIAVTSHYKRFNSLLLKVKTDPFIPKKIRSQIIDLLENRVEIFESIYLDELNEYKQSLADGKRVSADELEENRSIVHNKIVRQLDERGVGISQIEEEVNKIRLSIQDYLESFNPIK